MFALNNFSMNGIGISAVLVAMTPILLLVFSFFENRRTEYDDNQLMAENNVGITLRRGAAFLAMMIAVSGTLFSESKGFGTDVGYFLAEGVIVALTLYYSSRVMDMVILRGTDNDLALRDGNMSVAVLEGFMMVGLGVILSAAASGNSSSLIEGIVASIIFSVIGVIVMAVIYLAYGLLVSLLDRRNVDAEIANNNLRTAIMAGSVMLGVSLAIWPSLAGDSTGFASDMAAFGVYGGIGTLLVLLMHSAGGQLVLGSTLRRANNVSSAIMVACMTVGTGLLSAVAFA